MSVREYGNWIDGKWVEANEHFERHSTSSGKLVARFGKANLSDLDQAVACAKNSFAEGQWSELPGSEKAAVMNKFGDLVLSNIDRLSKIEADEAGKPLQGAKEEIEWSIQLLRYAATLAWNIPGRVVNHEGQDNVGMVTHNALPVVAMILPWNFPSVTLFQKLPYALAAGCSLVIKPSELTAGTTLEYAQLAKEAGIPDGVINVVTGSGKEVGAAMCEHPDVDMISFTGSTTVGRQIASVAGKNLKKVGLELGGKGANIVFADADIDAALEGALFAFTANQGEECCAGGRLLIESSIADEFVSRLAEKADAMQLGGPENPESEIGPMIHKEHLDKVLSFIECALNEGAELVTGGSAIVGGELANGLFVKPTIFNGVTPEMTLFKEEVFGPVLGVTVFDTVEEAIQLANDTDYGLANGVWTSNLDKAMLFSQKIDSGFVYINSYLETVPQLPFGGNKDSGIGRENGPEGLLEFMQTKSTFIKLN